MLMSVYYKETAENLRDSLNSILDQTKEADEIVLVQDGPLTSELEGTIKIYMHTHGHVLKIVKLPENMGLGKALAEGILHCSHPVVARMDTDDIAVRTRLEVQYKALLDNPEVAVIGANMEEFNCQIGDLGRVKMTPESHEKIVAQMKFRNPFNHPAVMYRKHAVIAAGNYNGDILLFEDYCLFLRMMLNNCRFYNIQQTLLHFRVGNGLGTIKRRSGMHYVKSEIAFVKYATRIGAFSKLNALFYLVLKIPIRLLPPKMVLFIYNKLLRKPVNE